jgi:hypothetical protein
MPLTDLARSVVPALVADGRTEASQMGQEPSVGREVLPIPDQAHVGLTTYDAKDPATSFPPIEPLRPPAGAPNVLVVLIDDTGFGPPAPSAGRSTPPPPNGWPPRG